MSNRRLVDVASKLVISAGLALWAIQPTVAFPLNEREDYQRYDAQWRSVGELPKKVADPGCISASDHVPRGGLRRWTGYPDGGSRPDRRPREASGDNGPRGRNESTCSYPRPHEGGRASTAPTKAAAPTSAPAAAATKPAAPVASAPAIPHTLEGRAECTTCHTVGGPGVGATGGTGLPQDHQGRTSATCTSCHKAA